MTQSLQILKPLAIRPRNKAALRRQDPEKYALEADIEGPVVTYAKKRGFYAAKFTSPSNRSRPDRLFVRGPFAFFIEFKAPGETATPSQQKEHEKIRKHSGLVFVIDNVERGKEVIDRMKNLIDKMWISE
jgi:hypothetical protein